MLFLCPTQENSNNPYSPLVFTYVEQLDADVVVIGSGMSGLTAACLLADKGLKVAVLEQNYLPGGCTSSYWRKGYWFESGATTLVGLDDHMPLKYVLDQTGITLDPILLETPMQVHLTDGTLVTRYRDLDQWIAEAERVFGKPGQRAFWEWCYYMSQRVWNNSLKQLTFPPTRFSDLIPLIRQANLGQVHMASKAFLSTQNLLKRFRLDQNQRFVDFVNEQLLISAQNHASEVNALFGAAALCYTNYGNYYIKGGNLNLVQPMVDYLEQKGSKVYLRTRVQTVQRTSTGYQTQTKAAQFNSRFLISALPVSNTLALFNDPKLEQKYRKKMLPTSQLWGAFTAGIAFKTAQPLTSIHHQIHLKEPLPETGSKSIFLSTSHPEDQTRAPEGITIGALSTHIKNPDPTKPLDKTIVLEAMINALEQSRLVHREDIVYSHSSGPKEWEKWTQRKDGFVGGYPQYFSIKPWQMIDARLDHKGAYICGDSTYPGQGIPGTCLSGIISVTKLLRDYPDLTKNR